jgi:hypothetical protein
MSFVRAAALLIAALGFPLLAAGCGHSGAGSPLPATSSPTIENEQQPGISTGGSRFAMTASAPNSGWDMHVTGPIVAVKSSTEFQINAGSSVGYLNVYLTSMTTAILNGLTVKVGDYANVYGNGTASTYITATQYELSTTSFTSTSTSTSATPAPAPASGWDMHVTGPIVAVQSSTEFQINAGSSIGYVNVYLTSTTIAIKNGLTTKVGEYANVYGNGTAGTYITATQYQLSTTSFTTTTAATPAPSTTSTTVPKHVLTAGLMYGYGGTPTTVSVSSAAPYISWAQTSSAYASSLRSAGVKVDIYLNFWRNYKSDNPSDGYTDLEPGGTHADAEAKTCSGTTVYDSSYGGGYEANALLTSYASGHAQKVAGDRETQYGGSYDALFSDDTGALWGIPLPCNYSDSSYKSATNSVHASLGKPMFVNTLNAGSSAVSQVGYTAASNILGAMCESCYSNDPSTGDSISTGAFWTDTENAEALMASKQKIFWGYARATGDASAETKLRMYVYASFLMTYSPQYSMLQEILKTPSGFEVFPETGVVPTSPTTTSSTVSGYYTSAGAYMRQYGACYYRGVDKGKCAVVVNPSPSSSVTVPTTAYSHAMTLSGYGVLDGGSVGFAGSRPSSLGPGSAAILFP